ncbi:MAG: hypothetical protein QXL94_04565 [Candidatus Parvarchaeum sp.]
MTGKVDGLIIILSILGAGAIFWGLWDFHIIINQNQILQFYALIATVSITILGFYITAVSILMFAFKEVGEKPGNLLNIIKSAQSYPQLYGYFLKAIYSFSITFLFALILYIVNLVVNLAITLEIITISISCIFLILSILYGMISIYLLSMVVKNFVKKS